MLHSLDPSSPDGEERDRDGQNARSSAFPLDNEQAFDSHSFGRMDRPLTPIPVSGLSLETDTHASPSRSRKSFVAPSISDDPFVLDRVLSPPWLDASRGGAYTTPPTRHGESHERNGLNTPSKPEVLYRDVLPGEITPYVGLRARLTQIPINRWTVLLMLVLARLIILFESLDTNLASAEDEAASACSKVEEIGSAMASMPHYLSVGVNELIATGFTDTVRGLINILNMILSSALGLLMLVIERTYGTIVCVIRTFIEVLITIAEDVVSGLGKAAEAIIEPITQSLATALSDLQIAIDTVADLFGNPPDLSGLDTGISNLQQFGSHFSTIIDDAVASIAKVNSDIPSFDEITADVQAIVGLPFTTIEGLLNESYGNWTMDPSMFPVSPKETMTFCTGDDAITDLFDALFTIVESAKIIAIVGLMVAAILAAAFMLWWEVKRYQRTVVKSSNLRNREPMDVVYILGRPLTADTGLWFSQKVSSDPNRQMLVRWVIAYATTYTALFILSLAVAGAFSVLCQYIVMRAVQKETPGLAQEVGSFATNVVDSLDSSSSQWANESNQAILALENDINNHVFGFVHEASNAVINVINTFENKTATALENFFGQSSIGQQADNVTMDLLTCVIFGTLDKAKSGLEWINSEAHVSLGEFPPDLFSMGAKNSSGDSTFTLLLSNSANQTANDITGALNKVVVMLQSNIIQEGLIALILFLVYIAYVFFAVAQAALRMCCMKERRPEDAEKGGQAMKNLQTTQHTICDEGRLDRISRPLSIAPSYRLSNLDVSQLARDLSVAQESPSRVIQRRQEHVEAEDVLREVGDPFGDDTYAIGDEEVDGIVGVLRDSKQMAHISTSRISQSFNDDPCATGDEEVDDILGVLRKSGEIVKTPETRNRQAWVEDADE